MQHGYPTRLLKGQAQKNRVIARLFLYCPVSRSCCQCVSPPFFVGKDKALH